MSQSQFGPFDFKSFLAKYPEPYRTLVKIMSEDWDKFNSFVVAGQYLPNKDVIMNFFSIVGLVPKHQFVECHSTVGGEHEEARCISRLEMVLPLLRESSLLNTMDSQLIAGILHRVLGIRKTHVIGMITLHEIVESGKEVAVLWVSQEIKRPLAEHCIKMVLEVRLAI